MQIVGTCINCLPASSGVALTLALAIASLALAIYRTA